MFMRWMILMALLAAAAPAAAQDEASGWKAALDRDMPRLLLEKQVPSVSIAKTVNGRLVLAAAYGEARPGVPATPETLYNVASLTTPVAAEVVLRLASRGKLSLDAPMAPTWVDPDVAGDPRHRLLTPRIALSHTTGFPNWRWMAADKRLAFGEAPGVKVGYSGEGYDYVARFAERKAGAPFDALAERLVMGPSGMASSGLTRKPWFAARMAQAYANAGKPVEISVRDTWSAADDLVTTASDYARFGAAVIRREGLTRDIARQRERVLASTRHLHCTGSKAASCPERLGFGLGWEVIGFGDRTMLWHTGADRGEFAVALLDLKAKTATVVLTNSRNGMNVVLAVLERVGTDEAFLKAMRAQAGE
jgi:CubicO group peptidase (beta-lactamase class C family)